ncbi:MAG: hypothetical protein JSR80_05795 [Verrucomicrobia bacterium]|nr:hypothetical protein [Verrucomicrobiota bacterium]
MTLLVFDQQKMRKALQQQAKKGGLLDVSRDKMMVFGRLFKGGRDTFRIISLFTEDKKIANITSVLTDCVKLFATVKAIFTVQDYFQETDSAKKGKKQIRCIRALGALAKKALNLPFMPKIKIFKWVALSINAFSGTFGVISNVQAMRGKQKKEKI